MKYLVMECYAGYAVVLDEQGGFRKVANLRYEVGQNVSEVVELKIPEKKKTVWWIPIVSAAACFVLVITAFFFYGFKPYASVYITINPEVRIDVNRNDLVVGVSGVNADAVTLLEGYDYRKKDLDTVMEQLVDRAVEMGFLHEGGTITLELDAEDQIWVAEHEAVLVEHLHSHFREHLPVYVEIIGCVHDHDEEDYDGDNHDEEGYDSDDHDEEDYDGDDHDEEGYDGDDHDGDGHDNGHDE